MRLIDADAFIAEMNERIEKAIKWGTNAIADRDTEIRLRAEQAVATFCEASLTAKKMPTIEERKTGKWVEVHGYCTPGGDPVWCCSECGKGVHVYGIEHGTYGADISDGQWKACPNCSALMEGEQP